MVPTVGGAVADAALGVEHVAFLRAERLRLPEHLPLARHRGARLLRAAGVLRKVQAEPAHEIAGAVVQLDGRRQPLPVQRRPLPHGKGARRSGGGRDAVGRAHEPGEPRIAVDLVARLERSAPAAAGGDSAPRRVLRGDEAPGCTLGEKADRGVEQQRRHQERHEQREYPRDRRGVPIPRDDPRAEERRGGAGAAGRQQPERRDARFRRGQERDRSQRRGDPARQQQRPDAPSAARQPPAATGQPPAPASRSTVPRVARPEAAEAAWCAVAFHGCREKLRRSMEDDCTIGCKQALGHHQQPADDDAGSELRGDQPQPAVARRAADAPERAAAGERRRRPTGPRAPRRSRRRKSGCRASTAACRRRQRRTSRARRRRRSAAATRGPCSSRTGGARACRTRRSSSGPISSSERDAAAASACAPTIARQARRTRRMSSRATAASATAAPAGERSRNAPSVTLSPAPSNARAQRHRAQSGRDWVKSGDRGARGRRGVGDEDALGSHRSDPAARWGENRLDVDQPQPERRRRHEQRRRRPAMRSLGQIRGPAGPRPGDGRPVS